jgi:hypothetical protein
VKPCNLNEIHTSFSAFKIYINGKTAYQYDPVAANYSPTGIYIAWPARYNNKMNSSLYKISYLTAIDFKLL